jgi:hypothetical protein
MRSFMTARRKCIARISNVLALIILGLSGLASAQNPILFTRQTNPPPPGVTPGANSYDTGQTWASQVCSSDNRPVPVGSEIEWAPVLDPGQDAETDLVAVSGMAVYNPSPSESGFCQGTQGRHCAGEPISCSVDSDCNSCSGSCDLGQGPSCTGGTCNSPWTNPQVGSPIACLNDTPCASCGVCSALGRSRGDMQMTHPFGFDYDAAIAPDPAYFALLSPGNVESTHVDTTGQTALDGFGGLVYPYLHATAKTSQLTEGWCTPDFSVRCYSSANCSVGNACEGAVTGLGLDRSTLPGVLGVETDHDLLPEGYQPQDADRTVLFGRWIVDCGHGDEAGTSGWHTEIHPPLLVATGRGTGSGSFGAHCSGDQTCSSMIGRPYLVSQQFGDGAFAKHIENEVEKLGCVAVTGPAVSVAIDLEGPFAGLPDCNLGLDVHCVCNGDLGCEACEAGSCLALGIFGTDAPFGLPCSTQLEERPQVKGVPFIGSQEMQYYIQPANGRLNPGDRMLAEWQLTARGGVTVELSNAGDAAGVLVDVTMNQSNYSAASLPPKQDWVVDPGEITPDFSWTGLLKLIGALAAPVQSAIVQRGLFTDRYQAPQVPLNSGGPTSAFADQLNGAVQAAQVIDDNQPFPVSGQINVGWFRCNPGQPYLAECTGPTTTVKLNGNGSSDPDDNPITFAWSGGFVGGSASGETPSVQFPGTGTFPVNLTVADSRAATSCSTTAKVQDTTPPAIAVSQPASTTYVHSATLTLSYTVSDVCTGVKSFTPTMDGSTSLTGHGLLSGQIIKLLTELKLGPHTFAISAVDNVGNADGSSTTFTIIVTADSIKSDVTQFLAAGDIKNSAVATTLLQMLNAAATARGRGDCKTAAKDYQSFITEVNKLKAQGLKGVDATAAAIMIADAQYLIAHCP